MITRTTTDPISLHDVPDPEDHRIYLNLKNDGNIVLKGDDSDGYITEG